MEDILKFLVNSIFSGVIGHYVSKGLGEIDKDLPEILKNDEVDISGLKDIISFKNLDDEIFNLAEEIKEIEMETKNINEGNVVNFSGGENNGIIANNLKIKTTNKTVKINPPEGSIASVLKYRNYTKHLIDRYHEFKVADVGKGKMNYAVLYGAIKRKFGTKWDLIPVHRFSELTLFLQDRIDKTILGKNKKSKDIKCYSTFEEYCEKHDI